MRHIMVDNENIPLKKIPDLGSDPCCFWLFTGNRQDKVPTELMQDMLKMQSEGLHNVQLITVNQTGDNALDFCLTYKMGQISKEYAVEDICFCVYSRDKGFDAVILHMLQHQQCAHAVRVSEEKYLALSEADLIKQVQPPQLKALPPQRPRHQTAARWIPLPREVVLVSVGAREAWRGLVEHVEVRARQHHHLIFRLREYVLKDWFQEHRVNDTEAVVHKIYERLLEQGSISVDVETGLLNYHFDYMEKVDEVMAKLHDCIENQPPKPPQSKPALINWFKVVAKSSFESDITTELSERLIQIAMWRGLLRVHQDERIAYRTPKSASPDHKTTAPANKTAAPAEKNKAAAEPKGASPKETQPFVVSPLRNFINDMVLILVDRFLFRPHNLQGFTEEVLFDAVREYGANHPVWLEAGEEERHKLEIRVKSELSFQYRLLEREEELLIPSPEALQAYQDVHKRFLHRYQNAQYRPQSYPELCRALDEINKEGKKQIEKVRYVVIVLQKQGFLRISPQDSSIEYLNTGVKEKPKEALLTETAQTSASSSSHNQETANQAAPTSASVASNPEAATAKALSEAAVQARPEALQTYTAQASASSPSQTQDAMSDAAPASALPLHDLSHDELWFYAYRCLRQHQSHLPPDDKSLVAMLEQSGLSKKDAEQAMFILIRKKNIVVHFEDNRCRLSYPNI